MGGFYSFTTNARHCVIASTFCLLSFLFFATTSLVYNHRRSRKSRDLGKLRARTASGIKGEKKKENGTRAVRKSFATAEFKGIAHPFFFSLAEREAVIFKTDLLSVAFFFFFFERVKKGKINKYGRVRKLGP